MVSSLIRGIALSALSAFAIGVAQATPLEIEDLPKLRHAGNITVAPTGDTVAYTLSIPRDVLAGDADGPADTHLYVIRGNNEPERFIGGEGSISGLQFSADGETLYFRARREGDSATSLYGISMNGGEATRAFAHKTSIGDYALAADGKTLYFVAKPEGENSAYTEKGFTAYAFEEDLIAAAIWKADISVEDGEAEILFNEGHVTSIDLSANGGVIVAAIAPTPLIDDFYMQRDLHVIRTLTGDQSARFELPGKLGGFEISPDGSQVVFHAGTDIHDTSDGVLMVGDMATGEFTQLTAAALQHVQDVDWLSDTEILATVHRGVESALVVYDTAGDEQRTLPAPDNIVVRSVATGGGAVRFIADSPLHPREVFSAIDGGTRRLSTHNAWLESYDLFPQSTFSYTARDEREIEGVLITPSGDAPETGWPLILTVHGGPEAHYSDGWLTAYSTAGQFGAGDGYAVFYPNYRGSTGRGVAFSKEHQDDYAGAEFNDLVDGVDALAEAGIIDPDRVGITGGSYGGYASMWGATALTDHFAAAVAFVGISNQVSKFGTSDIPNEMYLVHSLKWPWDDNWMNLLERSPIFHATQSTTPILILHGEDDTRVHPSQSLELHRALKVSTDTPVRLVFYPGEGHGNRKAAARYDYARRLMRWMDTYLAEDATRGDAMPDFDLGLDAVFTDADDGSDD